MVIRIEKLKNSEKILFLLLLFALKDQLNFHFLNFYKFFLIDDKNLIKKTNLNKFFS